MERGLGMGYCYTSHNLVVRWSSCSSPGQPWWNESPGSASSGLNAVLCPDLSSISSSRRSVSSPTEWSRQIGTSNRCFVRHRLAITQIRRIPSAPTRPLMLAIQWSVDQPPFASLHKHGFSSQPVASTKLAGDRRVVRRVIFEVTLIGGIVVVYLGRQESIYSQSSPLRWKWEEERLRGL